MSGIEQDYLAEQPVQNGLLNRNERSLFATKLNNFSDLGYILQNLFKPVDAATSDS